MKEMLKIAKSFLYMTYVKMDVRNLECHKSKHSLNSLSYIGLIAQNGMHTQKLHLYSV